MNRNPKFRTILTAFMVLVLLLGGTLSATGSSAMVDQAAPLPPGKQSVGSGALSGVPAALPPAPAGQGLYIRLTGYTFDPLIEATPHALPTELTLSDYPVGQEGYYLVQFNGPIQASWQQAVAAAGAQLLDYIPDFTFIVKMTPATKATLEALDGVRWVGLYQPGYRIAPSLAQGTGLADVTIVVFPDEDVTALAGQLQALGGTVLEVSQTHWKGKISAQIPRSQLDAVAHLSAVKWIEAAPVWELANNESADIMNVRDVWNTHGLYGSGQTVAVCDTGLDQGSTSPASLHDDFENGSGSSRVTAIYDRAGDGASDVNSGHGTHVAGSVLGNGIRSGSTPSGHTYPTTAYVGMAPEASLVFQAVENNSSGALTGIPADLNVLFNQVLGNGARIHTNSWGSNVSGTYTSSSEDVDEFVWDHKDFTILFAAGNAGVDSDGNGVIDLYSLNSPGTAKNCITVGATENDRPSGSTPTPGYDIPWGTGSWATLYPAAPISTDHVSNNSGGMAAFSSRGPVLDGRIKPDILAPGTNIASVRSSLASSPGWGAINTYYMFMGGTSMATPLTAGAAALVREYYTDGGVTPSAALIKATLINGATDISPGQYGTGSTREIPAPPRPNNVEGWGRVNVENSLFPTSPRTWLYYDETPGLSTSGTNTYDISVLNSSEPLKVTLAWSDYPGSPAASGGLVNDLDLSISGPGGTTYYPNRASQRGANQYLYYDDGMENGAYYWSPGIRVAVRFTPTSYPATLKEAQFRIGSVSSSYPKTFNYYIYDGSASGPSSVLASGSTTIRRDGWHVVDVSGHGVTVSSGDFFLAIGLPDSDLVWYYDSTSPIDGRSWDYNAGWSQWTGNDYMFRATVAGADYSTSFDRVNNVVGIDLNSPPVGDYTIRVQGYNVPHGPQPYALVASGAIVSTTTTAPVVTSITPNSGVNSGVVHITNLAGSNFQSGATVKLTKSGQSDINATSVVRVSASQITCDFDLTGAATGTWNVVVTNPDAQSGTLPDGFTVNPAAGTPTVSSITPNEANNSGVVHITNLAGSNFQSGATVKLTKSGQSDINATSVVRVSSSQITCDFDLTGATAGRWNVVVTNPGDLSGQLTNGFTVKGKVFLPIVLKEYPPQTDLYVQNDLGTTLHLTINGIGTRDVPTGLYHWGIFAPGTYDWSATASGYYPSSGTKTFSAGVYTWRFYAAASASSHVVEVLENNTSPQPR